MHLSYKKDYLKYIIIKITDKYIELNLDPTKPIKILLRDVVKIEFEQRKVPSILSFQAPAFRYPLFIVIRTNILKFQINVDDLEDVEKLINYLNSNIPEKNIYLPNIRYLDYIQNDKIHLNITKIMLAFLILFIFYVFITNDYHVSKFYDRNSTFRFVSRDGYICPRNYQTINYTNKIENYVYRYECGFFYKTFLVYEKNIGEDEVDNIYLNDASGMFTTSELIKYWFKSI